MQRIVQKCFDFNNKVCTLCKIEMTFAKELKLWRGDRTPKEVHSDLGVPLRTYYSWEESEREPSKWVQSQLREKMRLKFEPQRDMSRVDFFAKKFFPHLLLPHARGCVIEILKANQI